MREGARAERAGVRALAGVQARVLAQVVRVGEGAAAEGAGAAAAALVRLGEVAREAAGRAELLPADVAHAGARAGVYARVVHVGVRGAEPLPADAADVAQLAVDAAARGEQLLVRDVVGAGRPRVVVREVVVVLRVSLLRVSSFVGIGFGRIGEIRVTQLSVMVAHEMVSKSFQGCIEILIQV